MRVLIVGESRHNAGAFVHEWKRLLVVNPLQPGSGIASGLLFDRSDVLTKVLWLGLDYANGLSIDEQGVIRSPRIGLIFPNRDSGAAGEINVVLVLDAPARLGEHPVDAFSRRLFGCLIGFGHIVLASIAWIGAFLAGEFSQSRQRITE